MACFGEDGGEEEELLEDIDTDSLDMAKLVKNKIKLEFRV